MWKHTYFIEHLRRTVCREYIPMATGLAYCAEEPLLYVDTPQALFGFFLTVNLAVNGKPVA